MKSQGPIAFFLTRVGEENRYFEVNGQMVDIAEELAIPRASAADLRDVLYDQNDKKVAWEVVVAHLEHEFELAKAEWNETSHLAFAQSCNTLEANERKEMEDCLYDEDEANLDEFRRRKAVKDRIARGPALKVRWRRNFSDDLAWAWAHNQSTVIAAKSKQDTAKHRLGIAKAVLAALEHRMRVLSHLVAKER